MNRKTSKTPAKVQSLKHKGRPAKSDDSQLDNQWSFLEDEQDLVHFQHAYEFSPENRYFN